MNLIEALDVDAKRRANQNARNTEAPQNAVQLGEPLPQPI
jgi:hypothetical protein